MRDAPLFARRVPPAIVVTTRCQASKALAIDTFCSSEVPA